MLVVKPAGLEHLGTVLSILSKHKFTLCSMRFLSFDTCQELLNGDIIDRATRSTILGGTAAILEVLKSGSVNAVQTLIRDDFNEHTHGGSALFYAPGNAQDANFVIHSLIVVT